MKTILGYGRYDDDPEHVGCPRAKSDMTPCAARDGNTAVDTSGCCVGCIFPVADLLTELVRAVTVSAWLSASVVTPATKDAEK